MGTRSPLEEWLVYEHLPTGRLMRLDARSIIVTHKGDQYLPLGWLLDECWFPIVPENVIPQPPKEITLL